MSTINKINYEQFALDYLEGNLSGKMLEEMKVFLEKNPDINKELEEMELFYLKADDDIIFEGKENLLQPIVSKPKGIIIQPAILLIGLFVFLFCVGGTYIFINNSNSFNANQEIAIDKNKTVIQEEKELKEITPDIRIEKNIEANNKEIIKEIPVEKEPLLQSPNNIQGKKDEEVLIINEDTPIAIQTPQQPIINYIDSSPYNKSPEIANEVPPVYNIIKGEPKEEEVIVDNPTEDNKPKAEPLPIEIKTLDISTAIVTIGKQQDPIQLSNNIKIAEDILEIDEEYSQSSRLSRIGLFPERERRNINLKTIKDALTPEVFASAD